MLRLLSWRLPLPLPVLAGALLLISGSAASAAPIVYDMTGSQMLMTNQVCAPCTVAVTGTVTLDDDGLGNVSLLSMNLAHGNYEVASPGFVSVILERSSITLGAGSVAGSGSTLSAVTFGSTTLSQVGTITCNETPPAGLGPGSCAAFTPYPAGVTPMPGTLPGIDLSTWSFDGLGNITSASILYTNDPQAVETLSLIGTIVPEPGTALLLGTGLVGLALRRRVRA